MQKPASYCSSNRIATRQRLLALAAACLSITLPVTANANDSVGHLSAGGIVLARTGDIEMRQEELFVSAREIRVGYRFFNKSAKDIDTLVAFPMPDLPAPSDVMQYTVPAPDADNFMRFATTIDGKPVEMKVDKRAVVLGIDRTDRLAELGLPLNPYAARAEDAIARLAPDVRADLASIGVLREETFSDSPDGAMKSRHFPNWTLRSTYYWQQVFPASREIEVEHRYAPSVGASAGTMIGMSDAGQEMLADYKRKYCMDEAFLAAAARAQRAARAREGSSLMERRVEYVLATGANWAGPIKDFRLVVDKGSERNLVSFCGKNVRKIAATTFEMRASDHWPDRNLEVLILEPVDPGR